MLGGTKKLLAAVTTATVLLTGSLAHADGLYTPCMVQPVFVPATISLPIITPPEIIAPDFVLAAHSRWYILRDDIEPPNFILPTILVPRFDGCEEQNSIRRKELARIYGHGSLAGPLRTQPMKGSIAARVFTDADATKCCGGGR